MGRAVLPAGQGLTLAEPPEVVRHGAELLPPHSRVLDVGCHLGRTGVYLSRLGHTVESIDTDPIVIERATILAEYHQAPHSCKVRNATEINEVGIYDAVIATNILHWLSKPESREVIKNMQRATKIGGFNIVSAYVADPDQVDTDSGAFRVNDLAAAYDTAAWRILSQTGPVGKPIVQHHPSGPILKSQDTVIAQKMSGTSRLIMNANRQLVALPIS